LPRCRKRLLVRKHELRQPRLPTTSAIVHPDGTLLAYQPYGKEGLLVGEIDVSAPTCLLANRCRTEAMAVNTELSERE
jgi:hypothetical protein